MKHLYLLLIFTLSFSVYSQNIFLPIILTTLTMLQVLKQQLMHLNLHGVV